MHYCSQGQPGQPGPQGAVGPRGPQVGFHVHTLSCTYPYYHRENKEKLVILVMKEMKALSVLLDLQDLLVYLEQKVKL